HDERAQIVARAAAQQAVELAELLAARDAGEDLAQRIPREQQVVGALERVAGAPAVRVDDAGIELDGEPNLRLPECRVAVRDDRVEEEREKGEPQKQRAEAEAGEDALLAVTRADAARHGVLDGFAVRATHIAPDSGARRAAR